MSNIRRIALRSGGKEQGTAYENQTPDAAYNKLAKCIVLHVFINRFSKSLTILSVILDRLPAKFLSKQMATALMQSGPLFNTNRNQAIKPKKIQKPDTKTLQLDRSSSQAQNSQKAMIQDVVILKGPTVFVSSYGTYRKKLSFLPFTPIADDFDLPPLRNRLRFSKQQLSTGR